MVPSINQAKQSLLHTYTQVIALPGAVQVLWYMLYLYFSLQASKCASLYLVSEHGGHCLLLANFLL